jgi:MFS family permease
VPIRAGLIASAVLLGLFTLPDDPLLLAAAMVGVTAALGLFWAPAMALVSEAGEAAGLHLGMGFALTNLAWAGGQMIGSAGGGALASSLGDAAAPLLVAAVTLLTLGALPRRPQMAPT